MSTGHAINRPVDSVVAALIGGASPAPGGAAVFAFLQSTVLERLIPAGRGQPSGISSHHWHHQSPPTRILSSGCQQYDSSASGSR